MELNKDFKNIANVFAESASNILVLLTGQTVTPQTRLLADICANLNLSIVAGDYPQARRMLDTHQKCAEAFMDKVKADEAFWWLLKNLEEDYFIWLARLVDNPPFNDDDYRYRIRAASDGAARILRFLINDLGLSPNLSPSLQEKGAKSFLWSAIRNEQVECIDFLLSVGADTTGAWERLRANVNYAHSTTAKTIKDLFNKYKVPK